MAQVRDGFQSRLGFVLAAAGAAVGLGNIWGFPTQAANHGGGAFLLAYFIVIFLLALPALYTELYLGHQAQANPVKALKQAWQEKQPNVGAAAGYIGLSGAIVMLSFYSIVAGWMLAHSLEPLTSLFGMDAVSQFLTGDSTARNFVFTPLMLLLTAAIILKGVKSGIETWSRRLMPMLLLLLCCLIAYMATLEGAAEGFKAYLVPNFDKITDPDLIIAAMGQAFFSLSLGVGCMMIYGSYLKPNENLPKLTFSVAMLDTGVAFLAGLLIIPAIFVAQQNGVEVFQDGKLAGEGRLIFAILPELFKSMGQIGIWVGLTFFVLMSIASLTSTISSTEIPVSFLVENHGMGRRKATWIVTLVILVCSSLIIMNFDWLFGLVISVFTRYQLPLMGLFYFITVGWMWKRGNTLLLDATGLRYWFAQYLRFICPILMTAVFVNVVINK
ncbi:MULTISPECIES: sodium-dependent transporter [Pseudoalteromonas]|uniref:Na+-dependent transporter of the SNF family n=1 Tax=Pseudoalteromonas luteoviolacea (strain 2ta16) TaxID=1353533 RepID=V4HRA9_PSEL2|nr:MULTISPECIES: sodium-dependent transporter [Pseudoalteromonas]ESP93345.1 Na+-dependent transporter of the SNF family [Pseudoalteromonas luteoviolacea 2ta16]KZN32834.1 transporter [Pseudoalteromonas luteoviolacea NCIMB 1944]MCG7550282.1 sodium-dependent transporter [Pseudoalteromonas sp. Of7M-16]